MLGSRPAAAPSDAPALPEHMANQEFRFGLSGRNIDVVEELPLEIAAVGSTPGQKQSQTPKTSNLTFCGCHAGKLPGPALPALKSRLTCQVWACYGGHAGSFQVSDLE